MLEKKDLVVGQGAGGHRQKKRGVRPLHGPRDQRIRSSTRRVIRNEAFDFVLGTGQVIKGWDEGVVGHEGRGGRRTLTIPSRDGVRKRAGTRPRSQPNSTLVFDIELLDVK